MHPLRSLARPGNDALRAIFPSRLISQEGIWIASREVRQATSQPGRANDSNQSGTALVSGSIARR